jgi:UDP-N-acetylglucosamine 4-epimerase
MEDSKLARKGGELMKRLLVTGGAGFIGQNLIKAALESGWFVRSFDLVETSGIEHPSFEYIQGDVLEEKEVRLALKGCDAVVHLAAQVSVQRSFEAPKETMDINVKGTANVLDACKDLNIKRSIVASSAAVYGDQDSFPLLEELGGHFLSPYAESKWINEKQVLQAREEGMQAVALRFFNVYGPGQSTNGGYAAVIPKFIELMCAQKSPTVYGDGSHSRDFIHIDDLNTAILELLDLPWNEELSHVYNLATQSEISLLRLIDVINHSLLHKNIIKIPIEPNFTSEREGDIVRSLASIERLCSILNWRPKVDFQKAIDDLTELELRKEELGN